MKKFAIGMAIASSLFFMTGCNENPAGIAASNILNGQQVAATTQYEAENAALSGTAKKATNHSGASGNVFVDGYYNSTTALTTFTVNVATAGSYTLTTRYSAGNGTSSNTSLSVNGTVLKNITCNKTTNWDTWANQVETITLRAGNNTIAYKAASSSGACINIDYITVAGGTGTVYTITASAGANGTITPNGSVSVNSNANQTFTIAANSGYQVGAVTVDGTNRGAITTFTFSNVTANHTISATFTQVTSSFTITASAGANGTINPSGAVVVSGGTNRTFTISANSGYQISAVTVDGANQGAIASYTFNNVTASHSISATFVQQTSGGIYEAENATLSGSAKKNTNHTNYLGTGFVDGYFNSTTALTTFTVSVAAAGSYKLDLRYSAGNGTSSNTGLYVNGTKLRNTTCNATSNWDTWSTKSETVTLRAGSNTIAYKAETSSGSCINLDRLTISSASVNYTVTFNSQGGSAVASQTVASGNVATNPAAPTKPCNTFGGWYTTAACTTPWNFSTPITASITLYAKWTVEALVITSQPQPRTWNCDGNKSFSVGVNKSGVTYDWYFLWMGVSRRLADDNAPSRWLNYNTATMTVVMPTVNTGYSFFCVITDNCGNTVQSNLAQLIMATPVLPHPQGSPDLNMCISNPITINVCAGSYTWYIDFWGTGEFNPVDPGSIDIVGQGTPTLRSNTIAGSYVYCVIIDYNGVSHTTGKWFWGSMFCE